jgi:hypothetical protein
MDRIGQAATAPSADQPTTSSGDGSTFRAVAEGTSTERRPRQLAGTTRGGRAMSAADPTTDSGTWRLAL